MKREGKGGAENRNPEKGMSNQRINKNRYEQVDH